MTSRPDDAPRAALLAEDDDDLAASLTRVFERRGFHVRRARTGTDAVAMVRGASTLDTALVDLILPGTGGLDVVREVRRAFPACRIVAVSGVASSAVEAAFRDAGADVFLAKPVDVKTLLEVVGAPAA